MQPTHKQHNVGASDYTGVKPITAEVITYFTTTFEYDPDTGEVYRLVDSKNNHAKAGDPVTAKDSKGYRTLLVNNLNYKLHRVIWEVHVGALTSTSQIDHIDGDKLNNSIDNLREVDNQENHKNMPKQSNNTSGVTGVGFHKSSGKWRAYIKVKSTTIHLGMFTSKHLAVAARDHANKLYGFHANHGREQEAYSSKLTTLTSLGLLSGESTHRGRNVGASDYASHVIQPWSIWKDYQLNPWDADIIKRVLRIKEGDSRKLDYQKIMHICEERIAQLDGEYDE